MTTNRDERWLASLAELAAQRGDSDGLLRRAGSICRELRISPWIALGIAEGLIRLADAEVLDRAARCKDLQGAVLDRRMSLAELRTTMPYAPYLLAADLVEQIGGPTRWAVREAFAVADRLLALEIKVQADGTLAPVRTRPAGEYVSAAVRVAELRAQEGLDLDTAIEVAAGLLDVALARRRKRVLSAPPREGQDRRPFRPDSRRGPDSSGDSRPPARSAHA